MRGIKQVGAVLALSVLLVGLAACGGDDEAEEPSTVAPPGATQELATEGPEATGQPQATEETEEAEEEGAAAGFDACELVTTEEAEAVLGASAGEPTREDVPPISACSYETADFDSVSVAVVTFEDADEAEEVLQMAIDINDYPEISGLGDGAYDARPIYDVTVRKGRHELSIDVSVEGDEADFVAAKELAASAVERLP
jgi:hypothetical protein